MQEDKEAVFDTADTVRISLQIARIVLENLTVNESRGRSAASSGYLNATEMADYLVKRGVPFRSAHDIVGRAVLTAVEKGKELNELELADLRQFSGEFDDDIFDALSLESTLASKSQIGGTAPEQVAKALAAARSRFA